MKRKELKNLAKKIANQERILANSDDPSEVEAAQAEIMRLSGQIRDFQDLDLIDEMVQELLNADS